MLIAILFIFLFVLTFYNCYWKRRFLPHGPMPFPIIGNLYTLCHKYPHPDLIGAWLHWKRQYGSIYTMWYGETPYVVLTDPKLIREHVFTGPDADAFAGRHFFGPLFEVLSETRGAYGILRNPDLKSWRDIRRYSLQILHDLGLGRSAGETMILSEIVQLIGELKSSLMNEYNKNSYKSSTVSTIVQSQRLDLFSSSAANRIVFGFPIETSEDRLALVDLQYWSVRTTELFVQTRMNVFINNPWVRYEPLFFRPAYLKLEKTLSYLFEFYDRNIVQFIADRGDVDENLFPPWYEKKVKKFRKEQRRSQMLGGRSKNFIDLIFDKMEQEAESVDKNKPPKGSSFCFLQIRQAIFDVHSGMISTSTSLLFMVLHIMLDQRVQQRLQAELDSVLGPPKRLEDFDGTPSATLAHRPKLPYTCAVINESLRMTNLFPTNSPRVIVRPVEIEGTIFPTGTIFLPQISCVLVDPEVYPNPWRFLPERFLREETNGNEPSSPLKNVIDKKKEETFFMAFGGGKRACPGESWIRMKLFLFAANFLHQFEVHPVDPLNPPSAKKAPNSLATPDNFQFSVIPRILTL